MMVVMDVSKVESEGELREKERVRIIVRKERESTGEWWW